MQKSPNKEQYEENSASSPSLVYTSSLQTALDSRWNELKITGKNIVGRSNHIAVLFENVMYVHGGYSPEFGILSDFYCIDIGRDSPDFEWKKLNN